MLYRFIESIFEYRKKVNNNDWEFPDFHNCCPICGAVDCPVRIGYYYRFYIDILSAVLLPIPIARYMCRRKGKPKSKDRTFSLLPHVLIPYWRYTIDSVMYICGEKIVKGRPSSEIIQYVLDSFNIETELNFEERYLDDLLNIFLQTLFKLNAFLSSNNQDVEFLKGQERVKNGWHYLNDFKDDSGIYRGAAGFSVFSYEKQGGYSQNPQFMFGTAYQFL